MTHNFGSDVSLEKPIFFFGVCLFVLFCLRDLMSRRNGSLLFLFIVQCCRNPFEAHFFIFAMQFLKKKKKN